jgi:hypothetical protein
MSLINKIRSKVKSGFTNSKSTDDNLISQYSKRQKEIDKSRKFEMKQAALDKKMRQLEEKTKFQEQKNLYGEQKKKYRDAKLAPIRKNLEGIRKNLARNNQRMGGTSGGLGLGGRNSASFSAEDKARLDRSLYGTKEKTEKATQKRKEIVIRL